jgi:hypothetical protein
MPAIEGARIVAEDLVELGQKFRVGQRGLHDSASSISRWSRAGVFFITASRISLSKLPESADDQRLWVRLALAKERLQLVGDATLNAV